MSPVRVKFLSSTDNDLRNSLRLYTHWGCGTPCLCLGSPYSSFTYVPGPVLIKHAFHSCASVLINSAILPCLINSSIRKSRRASWSKRALASCCCCSICRALALVHLGTCGWVFCVFPLPFLEVCGDDDFGFLFTSIQGSSLGCASCCCCCGCCCWGSAGCGSGMLAMYGLILLTLTLISLRSILILMFPLSLTLVMRKGPDQLAANFLFLVRKLRSSNQICCPTW